MAVNVPKVRQPYILEDVASRSVVGGSTPSIETSWTIYLTDDHKLAEGLLLGATPSIYSTLLYNLYRKDWSITPNGRKQWRGTMQYSLPDSVDNREQMAFNVSGETVHITQALETIGKFRKEGQTAADFKGAIGVDKDGEVKGCDILTGKLSFSKTVYFPLAMVNEVFIKTLAGIVGRVNGTRFKTFDPGEVLFTGCSGSPQWDNERWEISYNFDTSPNLSDITIGDIKVNSKLGFDYLWVQYEKVDDQDAQQIAARPLQANVERVYRFADYSLLGIGN